MALVRRLLPLVLIAPLLHGYATASLAEAAPCARRLLVLSAFPGEIDKLLTEASVSQDETVVIDGRSFFVGTLRGNHVVLALSGIGLVNARRTTQAALDHFRCGSRPGIDGVVFSGVAGGRSFIGDVTVPRRWTIDDGASWLEVSPRMLRTARQLQRGGSVRLARHTPVGDAACVGLPPDLVRTVRMDHAPELIVGGDGTSADPFGGRAWPCFPGGGDVFGCEPCRAPSRAAPDPVRFVSTVVPFVDPEFFTSFFESPPPASTDYVAEDMESAAVARVAARNGVPFIAIRAISDGQGDPLGLPGFPFQFFVYRQLAADNAATVTLAFLDAWGRRTAR
jgi:nucleoside phosphorylase